MRILFKGMPYVRIEGVLSLPPRHTKSENPKLRKTKMTIYDLGMMTEIREIPRGCVVALGFFDGVHLGHRMIIDTARRLSIVRDSGVAVWTISQESGSYKTGKLALTDETERLMLLREAGAHYAAVSDFQGIRGMTGEEFVVRILKDTLSASEVVCGYNYRFGKGASCGVEELRELCSEQGISVTVADAVTDDSESAVSSTRIRGLISDGEVAEGGILLGRPYSFTSKVIHGKRLGRRLGFPTANQLIPEGRLTPKVGVYAVSVEFFDDGRRKIFPGAANIGYCPTLTEEVLSETGISFDSVGRDGAAGTGYAVCETYIVGYNGNLYGKDVKISFLRRLRGEVAFNGIDALKEQIRRDAEAATKIHGEIFGSFSVKR